MKNKVFMIIFMLMISFFFYAEEKKYSQTELQQDARELLEIIETTHPDPYINGGGKIAFHRKFQKVMQGIPESGMTLTEFELLLQPFVNSVGDGHTVVLHSNFKYDPKAPVGMPLWFSVSADGNFYVSRVASPGLAYLIGSKLLSVEELPLGVLIEKTRRLYPSQNHYDALWNLNGMLWQRYFLKEFLPESFKTNRLKVHIQLPDGMEKRLSIDLSKQRNYPLIKKGKSPLELPSTKKVDFAYLFLSPEKKTAFLRIDSQDGFREILEYGVYHKFDSKAIMQWGSPVYKRFNDKKPPKDIRSLISGIPSATQLFRQLVRDMKKAKTETLIIDLSRNTGGQSILSQILVYFLYGKEKLIELYQSSFTIEKYSDRYFQTFTQKNMKKINENHLKAHSWELVKTDYQFEEEVNQKRVKTRKSADNQTTQTLSEEYKAYTTFYQEYSGEKYNGYYVPPRVFVISNVKTYSAGFGSLLDLFKCGAKVVGVPSGQSANCFGNAIYYKLKNTGAAGFVSTKYIELLPGDAEKGKVLMPHYPLSYDIIKRYNFDPNSLYLYTLDLLTK